MTKFNLDALDQIEQQEFSKNAKAKEASILCVDDEPSNLNALKMLLEDDYNMFTANSGPEALEILQNHQIEVIITDQRMPELLGTELLEELMQRKLSNNVRIILTGFADVSVLLECINKGLIDRYILKPWSPEELIGTVRNAISKITTKRTLDKLVPERVMTKLFPEGLRDVKVGYGKEIQGAVLFADIQKFTSLVETMQVIDSFKLISSFFSYVGPIVEKHHGFIDKYLGDGVMAIFDNPETCVSDCVNCAIEMMAATEVYNETHRSNKNVPEFRKGQEARRPLELGLGLNFGQVVLGTVGCLDRIDVTVLGDAVNTSSRIQGLTGLLGTPILASENVIEKIDPKIRRRYLGQYIVRGKTRGIPLWEIYENDADSIKTAKDATKSLFEDAVKKVESGDRTGAVEAFNTVLAKNGDDKVAKRFVDCLSKEASELLFQMQHK